MSFSEKAYRLLLRAYPRDYRDQYAEPMEQLFRDRLREVRTFEGLASFWVGTLADWAVTVPARHWARATPCTSPAEPFRRCIFFACYEATSFSRNEITLEHLLLGVLRQEPSLVPEGREVVVRAIEAEEPGVRRRFAVANDLRLSRETFRAVTAAKEIAQTAGRGQAAPRDLLAGILREPGTLAARVLRGHIRDPL